MEYRIGQNMVKLEQSMRTIYRDMCCFRRGTRWYNPFAPLLAMCLLVFLLLAWFLFVQGSLIKQFSVFQCPSYFQSFKYYVSLKFCICMGQVQALRGEIRETYSEMLGIDPEFCSSKDVELLLWKNCYYKRIEVHSSK